ncbi:MAG: hypothetical protein KGV43_00465, partial [Arcobacter sp.]|nr:hypothetical protein [Arcobacter sp.]
MSDNKQINVLSLGKIKNEKVVSSKNEKKEKGATSFFDSMLDKVKNKIKNSDKKEDVKISDIPKNKENINPNLNNKSVLDGLALRSKLSKQDASEVKAEEKPKSLMDRLVEENTKKVKIKTENKETKE